MDGEWKRVFDGCLNTLTQVGLALMVVTVFQVVFRYVYIDHSCGVRADQDDLLMAHIHRFNDCNEGWYDQVDFRRKGFVKKHHL